VSKPSLERGRAGGGGGGRETEKEEEKNERKKRRKEKKRSLRKEKEGCLCNFVDFKIFVAFSYLLLIGT